MNARARATFSSTIVIIQPTIDLFRKSDEILYPARARTNNRSPATRARKSEISVAACRAHRGFRSWWFQRGSTRRGGAGQGRWTLRISLRDSVGLDRLSRTRPATPPRSGDDDRNGAGSPLVDRPKETMPAVKHAIRQKVYGENERCKGKERKSERKEKTTQRSRERELEGAEKEREKERKEERENLSEGRRCGMRGW